MTQTSWPYVGDAVTESEWMAMARLWRRSGVIDGADDELEVTAVAGNLQVEVPAGEAWLDGFYYASDAAETLDLDDADLNDDRIDLVVVRSDLSAGEARLAVKTGTPAGSPAAPSVTQDHEGSDVYEIALAEVLVEAAAANVDGNVTDVRTFSLKPGDVLGDLEDVDDSGGSEGDSLTKQADGSWAPGSATSAPESVVAGGPAGLSWTMPGWAYLIAATGAVTGRVFYTPIYVGRETTYDRIAISVDVAGDADAEARLGIYAWDGGSPGGLLLDAGTVPVDSTGDKEIVIDETISPGMYFLAVVHDSASNPDLDGIDDSQSWSSPVGAFGTGPGAAALATSLDTDGRSGDVAGGLPDPAPTVDGPGNVRRSFVRLREAT